MSECIFCKIINKEIPNYTLYEDEHVLAFLDVFPRARGHALVIPKAHIERSASLPEEMVGILFGSVLKVKRKISDILKPDGFNIGWNDGYAAGQSVPHLHIHIIPRWGDDKGGNMHSIVNRPGDMPIEEVYSLFS